MILLLNVVRAFRLNCTGEEDWTALFAQRAMVYRLDSGRWTERCTGQLKIMKHTSQRKLWTEYQNKDFRFL